MPSFKGIVRLAVFLSLLILALFYGCETSKQPAGSVSTSDVDLFQKWKLEKILDGQNRLLLVPSQDWEYAIEFLKNDSLRVKDACNVGFGTFSLGQNNTIEIRVTCTEVACSDNYRKYCSDLSSSLRFDIVDGRLLLYASRNGQDKILVHQPVE